MLRPARYAVDCGFANDLFTTETCCGGRFHMFWVGKHEPFFWFIKSCAKANLTCGGNGGKTCGDRRYFDGQFVSTAMAAQ